MNELLSRVILLVLIATLALSCGSKDEGASGSAGGEDQGAAEIDADATSTSLADLLRQIETTQAKMPKDRVDAAAVIAGMREPAEILAWVSENTRAISYEGSLRGSAGVLMDRRGNSLDRALLTGRLLKLAGYDVRIVGGTPPASAAPVNQVPQAGSAPEPGNDEKAAAEIAAAILARTGPFTIAKPVVESRHYWTQFNDGKSWIDADPTIGLIGQARTRTDVRPIALDPETQSIVRNDADRLLHTVKMSVIVERWEAGKLSESPLAAVSFDASTGPLSAITLTFVPVDREGSKAAVRNFATGAELYESLRSESAWAVVMGGYDSVLGMGKMFDYAGIVRDAPRAFDETSGLGGAVGSSFGNFMDAFGGGPDPALEPEPEERSVLTAVIADYEIAVPGKPARRIRRFVFDSLGPEARDSPSRDLARPVWSDQQRIERGVRLAGLHDTLVAFASMTPDVYAYRFAQRISDAKDAILKVVEGSTDAALVERARHGSSFRTLELFAALRGSTMNPGLAVAEPQIYRREIRYTADLGASELQVDLLGDLAWNCLVPAADSVQAVDLVTQGALDTLQESAIVLADDSTQPNQSTPALFEEAARQGIDLTVVRGPSDAVLVEFPGPARARMLGDLRAGQILVTPRSPVSVGDQPTLGWWRIDPDTGQMVGAMDNGLMAIWEYVFPLTATSTVVIQRAAPLAPRAQQWVNQAARMRIDQKMQNTEAMIRSMINYAEKMIAEGRGDMLGF